MNMKKKKISELVSGDLTPWYKIISIAVKNGKANATVLFNDGGIGQREWDDVNRMIELSE